MRLFRLIITCFCCILLLHPEAALAKKHRRVTHGHASNAAWGVNDPRYSAFVVDPQTGEIYHSKSADVRRYPASLTKMMTLYLLFEALDNKSISLNTRMPVSDYATTMPQTNLALSPGEEIPVDTAIKALVVRSANDVAVVVAEKLGGDVDHFGELMTAKAHALGMKDTHFENPNGLPNAEQYTTARDMAKLGIALKRDFPKYYSYFAVREFSWAGVSYYTHNRVMLRYAGVDGIKTGFIGASGFNLVTSCKRGGRPLVGVVMGGSSGRWRDDRMIQLLDQTYQLIASRGAARGKGDASNLPLSLHGGAATVPAASDDSHGDTPDTPDTMTVNPPANTAAAAADNAKDSDDSEAANLAVPAAAVATKAAVAGAKPAAPTASVTPVAPVNATASAAVTPTAPAKQTGDTITKLTPVTTATATVKPVNEPAASAVKPATTTNTTPAVTATTAPAKSAAAAVVPTKPTAVAQPIITPANQPLVTAVPLDWSIQVGAFGSAKLAESAAQQAYRLARMNLNGAMVRILPPAANAAESTYRARLIHISDMQARKACAVLEANHSPCMAIKDAP